MQETRWALRLGEEVIEIPGSFNRKYREAKKIIFPLTEETQRLGYLPLSEEEQKIVWLTIPQLSLTPLLCEVNPTFTPERGMSMTMLRKTEWNLRKEAELLPLHNKYPTPNHQFLMNIIIWNSRGALKPNF